MNITDVNLDEFIVIDVETTGLDLYNDKIIEISAVKFKNKKIVDKFTKLINPNKKISLFIENLTGITNQDVSDSPEFNEISSDLIKFLDSTPIVGHNIKFDIDFINNELNGLFDLYTLPIVCDTYHLSKIFLYNFHSFKLKSLCEHFKINLEVAHRAEDDAINTGYLFIKILDIMFNSQLEYFNDLYKVYSKNMIINRKLFCCVL